MCFGDSGGPSTYLGPEGPEQVGVSSTVDPGCVGGGPAESARVDPHIDWMLQYVPELILDYDDLPQEEVEGPAEDGSRSWNDLGVDHTNRLANWEDRDPLAAGGCTHAPPIPAAGLLLALLLLRRCPHLAQIKRGSA